MENAEQPQFKPIPRSELVAMSMFGSDEERELARRLLPNTPVEREPEHPLLMLKRLYPEGSEAERISDDSPIGRLINDLVNSEPEQLGGDELEIAVTDKVPLLPLPLKAPAAPVENDKNTCRRRCG
jgi:hypothetical protein